MIYREDKYGNKVSQLGFGCMRFLRKGPQIDYEPAKELISAAIENGINYFDTAYIYPGSEELLGRVLEETGLRSKVNIATKLPQYMIRTAAAIDKTFNEELSRLRTDYIDYYLLHMFTDIVEWEKLEALGIRDWIKKRKEEGRIKQIGFSYHGNSDMFLKILDAYPWDFCQIQYNYIDEHSQAGLKGLEGAREKGIPVIIMEPLRGGKLVNLPSKAMEELKRDSHGYSPAELGLRWLWNQEGVTCVLSGMNSMDMLTENIRVASEASVGSLTNEDMEVVSRIKAIIKEKEKVGCTGCRYCMPCPHGVDIPGAFHHYNLLYMENKKSSARKEYLMSFGLRKEPCLPSQCVACGKCEKHCPQHIDIINKLKEADRELLPLHYRIGLGIARRFFGR